LGRRNVSLTLHRTYTSYPLFLEKCYRENEKIFVPFESPVLGLSGRGWIACLPPPKIAISPASV
jgi:hypothetical protein